MLPKLGLGIGLAERQQPKLFALSWA